MINRIVSTFCTSQSSRLFLFAGQGTQQIGMLDSIQNPLKEQTLSMAHKLLGIDFAQISTVDAAKQINQTQITQPLLMLSHYLYFRKDGFDSSLTKNDWMIGHSLGQFSALVNAGSISLSDGLKLVHLRGTLMQKHTKGTHGMLIVKFKAERQQEIREEIQKAELEIACINTKTNLIIAGETNKINQLAKTMRKLQAAALTLPVSTAFHCKMLQAMKEEFSQALNRINFKTPKCTILSNYDCQPYSSAESIRAGLLHQLTNPVRFQQSVQKVPQSARLIEVGQKRWISKFAEEARRDFFLQSLLS